MNGKVEVGEEEKRAVKGGPWGEGTERGVWCERLWGSEVGGVRGKYDRVGEKMAPWRAA